MDLEEIWRIREEKAYPKLFGPNGRGIFTLSAELFTGKFRQTQIDPRWLFYGIFEFAPTQDRPSWLYVTSGHSNPWDWDDTAEGAEPAAESGAGIEFLFATTEQGNWAISYLQNMLAYDLLLSADRFPGGSPIGVGDRIPLNSPINSKDECVLRHAIVSTTQALPTGFTLPSGKVEFMTFTGVTDAEISFARANSTLALVERLSAAGAHPVTDPARASIF